MCFRSKLYISFPWKPALFAMNVTHLKYKLLGLSPAVHSLKSDLEEWGGRGARRKKELVYV